MACIINKLFLDYITEFNSINEGIVSIDFAVTQTKVIEKTDGNGVTTKDTFHTLHCVYTSTVPALLDLLLSDNPLGIKNILSLNFFYSPSSALTSWKFPVRPSLSDTTELPVEEDGSLAKLSISFTNIFTISAKYLDLQNTLYSTLLLFSPTEDVLFSSEAFTNKIMSVKHHLLPKPSQFISKLIPLLSSVITKSQGYDVRNSRTTLYETITLARDLVRMYFIAVSYKRTGIFVSAISDDQQDLLDLFNLSSAPWAYVTACQKKCEALLVQDVRFTSSSLAQAEEIANTVIKAYLLDTLLVGVFPPEQSSQLVTI